MKIKPSQKPGEVVMQVGQTDSDFLAAAPPFFKLKHILVPVDFSGCSRKALQYAMPFASAFQARLTLLHVIQVNYGAGEFGLIDVPRLEKQMREGAGQELASFAETEVRPGLPVETAVVIGRPVSEIVHMAKESQVDLIIIATHGHTGIRHVLLGSTVENVVRHAPCPVLTVREHEHEFVTS